MAPQRSYELGRVPRTLVGVDALNGLGAALDLLSGSKAVVIADPGVQATGYIDRVVAAVRPRDVTVHLVPWGEPNVESVDAAAQVVRDVGEAIVIGVGGGSALDIAKQAAVVSTGPSGVEPYVLCAEPLPGRRSIVAIPTTSGTGAEVTRTCIVADRTGRKLWTWGDEMLPDVVVLDPTAAATMPRSVTVGTGLDAFVHAIEACSGQRRNSIAAASAQRAMALVLAHLPRVANDGSDLQSRQAMQEAAFLAGLAIDNCGTAWPTRSATRSVRCTTCLTASPWPSVCVPRWGGTAPANPMPMSTRRARLIAASRRFRRGSPRCATPSAWPRQWPGSTRSCRSTTSPTR